MHLRQVLKYIGHMCSSPNTSLLVKIQCVRYTFSPLKIGHISTYWEFANYFIALAYIVCYTSECDRAFTGEKPMAMYVDGFILEVYNAGGSD